MPDVSAEAIQACLAQGMSQRAIAKQLNIPRTTLQRLIARQNGSPARPATEVRSGNPTVILAREVDPERGVPADMVFDLVELVEWWRQRKRIAKKSGEAIDSPLP